MRLQKTLHENFSRKLLNELYHAPRNRPWSSKNVEYQNMPQSAIIYTYKVKLCVSQNVGVGLGPRAEKWERGGERERFNYQLDS